LEAGATVDRNRVALGQRFALTVSVKNGEAQVETGPLEEDFRVLSQSTSTSVSIVNNQMSRVVEHRFVLTPRRIGTLTVPALTVRGQGRAAQTSPITIEVVEKPDQAPADEGLVTMETSISREKPYVGETVVYTIKVFVGGRIANPNLDPPEFQGFSVNPLPEPKTYDQTRDGRRYKVTELAYLLTPLEAGPRTIEAPVLDVDLVVQGRDQGSGGSMFDRFFGQDPFFSRHEFVPRMFQGRPLSVDVRPWPPYMGDGRFSGLIGRFDLEARLDRGRAEVGQSVTLTVTVSGQGNIMDAGQPRLDIPATVKVYEDEPEEEISLTEDGYRGRKTFRLAVVPLEPGTINIPRVQLTYFDVARRQYQTVSSQPLVLEALPADRPERAVVSRPDRPGRAVEDKTEVRYLEKDILTVKDPSGELADQGPLPPALFLVLVLIPPAALAAVWVAVRVGSRRPTVGREMAGRARAAVRRAEAASGPEAAPLCAKAVTAAVCSLAERRAESLTYDEITQLLQQHGADPEDVRAAARLMERIDAARYGGGRASEDLVAETRRLIKKVCR
jgi:hypothetical protein